MAAGVFLAASSLRAAEVASERSITVGDVLRTYTVHRPSQPADKPALVIVLHGGGGQGRGMVGLTRHRFDELADRDGAIVAYPDGLDRGWNDGRDHPRREREVPPDDVGFIRALVDDLGRSDAIDRSRVYATGMSNGAMMCFRLARELPDTFAAVSPVCGLLPRGHEGLPWPKPVSLLLMVGTEDPLVPYAGGDITVGSFSGGPVLSAAATVAAIIAQDHLQATPVERALPDADAQDGTTGRISCYRSDGGESELCVYTITGGGHTWAGGLQYLPERVIGRTSRDLDACDEIWKFFSAHHR